MRHDVFIVSVALLLITFTGCGAPTPLRTFGHTTELEVPDHTPITVQPEQMETITFGRTIVDIPIGATVGRVMIDDSLLREVTMKEADLSEGARQWSRMGLDELRSAGYPALGQENLLFGEDESGKSRYILGGTVNQLLWVVHSSQYQYRDDYTPMECGITINWQVFDTNTRQVVLTKRLRGYAERVGAATVINASVRSSFRALLADAEFVSAVKKKTLAGATTLPTAFSPLVLAAPRGADLDLPHDMKGVTDAVVTVRVGSTHGSGFLISTDGYILTAAHVVGRRETCLVKLSDGRQAEARVWRTDPAADVALLRIADGKYPALQLALGAVPDVGTEVYAVGTPLMEDLERSVSKGIVSAERSKEGRDLIQTDAAVNSGNSGGPLLDHTGHVIGIVSLKVALPGYSGIAFAVPIKTAVMRLALQPKSN